MQKRPFRDHFRPIRIGTSDMPPRLRRLAVRLRPCIGPHKTAYLFGVKPATVCTWARQQAADPDPCPRRDNGE